MHASHYSTVEAFHVFFTNCRILLLRFSSLLILWVLCVCVCLNIITHIFDSSNGHVQVLLKII